MQPCKKGWQVLVWKRGSESDSSAVFKTENGITMMCKVEQRMKYSEQTDSYTVGHRCRHHTGKQQFFSRLLATETLI